MENNTEYDITILGSGTSTGVPVIGCPCQVCVEKKPKNVRTRASILLQNLSSNKNLLIDTSPDLRQQMLNQKISHMDYVLFTHTHADHLHGFDDLRAFCFSGKKIPVWIHETHVEDFRQRFSYIFNPGSYKGAVALVELNILKGKRGHFSIGDLLVEYALVPHGGMGSTVYRFGNFLYATDFECFHDSMIEDWKNQVEFMIASGLRYRPHHAHSHIPSTLKLFEELKIKQGVVSHLSHEVCYYKRSNELPQNTCFAYDGFQHRMVIHSDSKN